MLSSWPASRHGIMLQQRQPSACRAKLRLAHRLMSYRRRLWQAWLAVFAMGPAGSSAGAVVLASVSAQRLNSRCVVRQAASWQSRASWRRGSVGGAVGQRARIKRPSTGVAMNARNRVSWHALMALAASARRRAGRVRRSIGEAHKCVAETESIKCSHRLSTRRDAAAPLASESMSIIDASKSASPSSQPEACCRWQGKI